MTQQIPAERIVPGVALQRVNSYDPATGEFVRQVRAYAEIGFWHPSRPRWHELRAIIFAR